MDRHTLEFGRWIDIYHKEEKEKKERKKKEKKKEKKGEKVP